MSSRRISSNQMGRTLAELPGAERQPAAAEAGLSRRSVYCLAAIARAVDACLLREEDHRAKIRSTNPLERVNGEIEHRTDVVGIFPNEAAITRDSIGLFRRRSMRLILRRDFG